MRAVVLALAAAALLSAAHADLGRGQAGQAAEMHGNPIRKVVTLLQKMQVKVSAEGEKEKELYEKFECYCKKGDAELSAAVSAASGKVPEVISAIREQEAKKVQLEQDLKDHQTGRSEAKEAIAKATAIREKDAAAHGQESAEYKSNVAALKGAIEAVSKGMAGGFLQTSTAQIIRRIALSGPPMNDVDRQDLLAFMQGGGQDGYMPRSGEITGILNQLKDEMDKSLADITDEESTAISQHEELMAAKGKEIQALTTSIEQKSQRVGELAISIVMAKNDLSDTEAALAQDQELLAGLTRSCEGKAKEWEARQATRAEELVALAEVIKVLNDDDALELFKKTLPSASLLQVASDESKHRKKALNVIENMRHRRGSRPELDFMVLALQGKKVDMSKVIKMIDNMAALLKQEQDDDDQKKEYCEKQIDFVEDKGKELAKKVEDLSISVEEKGEAIKEVIAELKGLAKGIQELDKMVAEATEDRKEANAEYTELMSSNTAAKELLTYAKNRLNKFYNPGLYKAPPKRELNEEEQIYTSMGGELEPTAAPGGIAGTGVTALEQGEASLVQVSLHDHSVDGDDKQQQPPPPSTWGAYQKKNSETTGVVAMVDLLIRDIDKEMTEAEVGEKNSQKEYEETMNDAAKKRAADLKSIAGKEKAKADLEEGKATDEASKEVETQELQATRMVEMQLHQECDWLVQNFDLRKSARAEEADALQQAKAILSGADFTLVQGQAAAPASRNLRGV